MRILAFSRRKARRSLEFFSREVKGRVLFLIFLLGMSVLRAVAIEVTVDGNATFNTNAPTSSDIPNWDTGWPESGTTGWDYVGTVNGASGVYLGNGWVLTAGHVGAGDFTLQGETYDAVPGSAQGFSNSTGTADLTLFQLAQSPALPPLTLETTTPVRLSHSHQGNQVAMIGYGGGYGETWGLNTVTAVNQDTEVEGYSYDTVDFETAYGTTTDGSYSATNNAFLVGGDSGGGDFIYDSSTGSWVLAGINEAVDTTNNNSYMVQLSAYASQIDPIVDVPEPRQYVLIGLALALLMVVRPRTGKLSAD